MQKHLAERMTFKVGAAQKQQQGGGARGLFVGGLKPWFQRPVCGQSLKRNQAEQAAAARWVATACRDAAVHECR